MAHPLELKNGEVSRHPERSERATEVSECEDNYGDSEKSEIGRAANRIADADSRVTRAEREGSDYFAGRKWRPPT